MKEKSAGKIFVKVKLKMVTTIFGRKMILRVVEQIRVVQEAKRAFEVSAWSRDFSAFWAKAAQFTSTELVNRESLLL